MCSHIFCIARWIAAFAKWDFICEAWGRAANAFEVLPSCHKFSLVTPQLPWHTHTQTHLCNRKKKVYQSMTEYIICAGTWTSDEQTQQQKNTPCFSPEHPKQTLISAASDLFQVQTAIRTACVTACMYRVLQSHYLPASHLGNSPKTQDCTRFKVMIRWN